jgi:hydrogenase/urease accessory protein HupE
VGEPNPYVRLAFSAGARWPFPRFTFALALITSPMTRWTHFWSVLASLLATTHVLAHDPGLSSARVRASETQLELALTFATADIASTLSGSAGSTASADELVERLNGETLKSESAWVQASFDRTLGENVRPTVMRGPDNVGEVVVTYIWPRSSSAAMRLEFPILSRLPFGHRMFLTADDSSVAPALLDARRATWEWKLPTAMVSPGGREVASEPAVPWMSFVALGVEHILIGFDHLCFLFALLLVANRGRDVLAVITTFTVAHSLTLVAAAMGLISMPARLVELLIAASIIYIGVENIILRRAPRYRLALIFAFGLVHGLGFASVLAERLPQMSGVSVVAPMLGFNLGVELGQLAVAACLVPLILLVRRRPSVALRFQPACSLLVALAGAVWFAQRV